MKFLFLVITSNGEVNVIAVPNSFMSSAKFYDRLAVEHSTTNYNFLYVDFEHMVFMMTHGDLPMDHVSAFVLSEKYDINLPTCEGWKNWRLGAGRNSVYTTRRL